MAKNPFAFKIDYAKEIAYDESQIALLSDPTYIKVCELVTRANPGFCGAEAVFLWVTTNESGWRTTEDIQVRAALVNLSLTDLQDLSFYLDMYTEESPFPAPASPESYRRGEAITKERFLGWELVPSAIRIARLKKAKADLARHQRNQQKFTGK